MSPLRKIPLEQFIQILQDLYDSGADYVDISGDTDVNGELKDTIKITVKPDYMSDNDELEIKENLDADSLEDNKLLGLSEADINDLI